MQCNKKMLLQFPNLWAYTRDMYQLPGVAPTVNFYHINKHYWVSHRAKCHWATTSNPLTTKPITT